MKHVYIDSRLDTLALAWRQADPETWVFSQGRPWLLLTPRRLARLAAILGLHDAAIGRLADAVRRHSPGPQHFLAPLGLESVPPDSDGSYPMAICPNCDSVHYPHPLDAALACPRCRRRQEERAALSPLPGVLRDQAADRRARAVIQENDPGAFDNGVLSPNWRLNYARRLDRDWEEAVARIRAGQTYRCVARDFDCSLGLLHKKVHERHAWENN